MFDELRYQWKLKRFLNERDKITKSYDYGPDYQPEPDGVDLRRAHERAWMMHEIEIDQFRSSYLVEQAYKYHVSVPVDDEGAWMNPRYSTERYLTPAAATKVRTEIWAEKKARWEYLQTRVSLTFSAVALVVAFLAYLKR